MKPLTSSHVVEQSPVTGVVDVYIRRLVVKPPTRTPTWNCVYPPKDRRQLSKFRIKNHLVHLPSPFLIMANFSKASRFEGKVVLSRTSLIGTLTDNYMENSRSKTTGFISPMKASRTRAGIEQQQKELISQEELARAERVSSLLENDASSALFSFHHLIPWPLRAFVLCTCQAAIP